MSHCWIEVWNKPRTTRYGEIASASAPSFAMLLDASAQWSFTMPVGDPNAALLANERLVEAYTESVYGPRLIGAGIVKDIALSEDGESLNVSGSDLLSLLAGYSVGQLKIMDRNWTYLNNSRGSVRRMRRNAGGSETNLDLTNAYDGNTGTSVAVEMRPIVSEVNYCFLYICCDQLFSQIRVTMGATKQTVTNTLVGQYFNGTAMVGLTITSDGTLSVGKTFAQTGIVIFTEPTDWQRISTSDGGNWYIVRLCVSTTDTNTFDLAEIECYADGPTNDGLSKIIACIPAGEPAWSIVNPVTAWSTTLNAAYLDFDGESVLTAFISLAKATGEHFRLPTPGEATGASARTICWQRTTWGTLTGHAELIPDAMVAPAGSGAIPILGISAHGDSAELVTRVYPHGAGAGAARATLQAVTAAKAATVVAPYVLDVVNNCIYNSTAEASYGRIEAPQTFDNISAIAEDAQSMADQLAADQLCDAALAWLKTHDSIARFYSLTISYQGLGVYPIDRLHAVAEVYRQAYKAINLNTFASGALYVTGVTERIEDSGADVLDLELSTVERAAESDASVLSNTIKQVRNVQQEGISGDQTIHAIATGNASLTGGTINGVTIGATNPAAGRFRSLSSASELDVTHPAFGATGDGVTDDTAAIQAAITAASVLGGAVVYLPAGTYVIPTYLSIPSHVWLRGAGDTSVIKRADYKDGTGGMHLLISTTAATGIIISDLVVDGNGHNQVVATGTNMNQCNIRLVQATDSIIERVISHDAVNTAIYLESCVGCAVRNNVCYGVVGSPGGNYGEGIGLHYGHNNVIANNVCHDNFNNGIVTSETDATIISANASFNNGQGIEIAATSATIFCRNTTVVGNLCYNNAYRGIAISGLDPTYLLGGSFSANQCWHNGYEGIVVIAATRISITGNDCSDNGLSGIRAQHLYDSVIANNTISGNNLSDVADRAGIYLSATCPRNQIYGNSITNGAAGLQDYAINLSASTVTNTTIGPNNLVDGGTTAPINDAGSNTIIYSRHSVWITPAHLHRSNANLTVDADAAVGIWARAITTANQTMYFDVPTIRDDNSSYHWVESLTIYYQTLSAGTEKINTYALYRRNMSNAAIVTVLSGAGTAPGAAGLYTIINTPASPVVIDYRSAEKQLYLGIIVAGESTAGYLRVFGAVLVYHDMTTMYHHD